MSKLTPRMTATRVPSLLEGGEVEVYIYYDGERYGPATLEELASMWADGEIHADAHIWHTGLDAWVPAAKFRPPRMSPPPAPAPAAAVVAANFDAFGPAALRPGQVACPYCHNPIGATATRCVHCQGEIVRCPKCQRGVAFDTAQKFVGFIRGGSVPVRKCMSCGTQLSGPRF